jgi:3-hydroxyacyl-CoA dehydrogenase/enoyl-CoA hydratase/3-hydroxybutyryl-CoA epimerase
MDEALKLLQEGATVDAIDDAMTAFGFPVGPLKLIDEVGIDVGAHVTNVIAPVFEARGIELVKSNEEILKAGLKGRKSGKGFYSYEGGKSQGVNAEIYKYFASERRTVPRSEIQERLSLAMINEAVLCLQEGVIASPRDGDVGAVFGIGFPPFLGGPFFYIDQQGVASVLARLQKLTEKHPRFKACGLLEEYATSNIKFYG